MRLSRQSVHDSMRMLKSRLRITPDNVRNHLRKMGVRVSDKLWRIELKPEFELILSELYQVHDDVVRELNKRLA